MLRSTGLEAETEGLIIAAQDHSLSTKSYFAWIVKDGTSPLCRICHKHEEAVDHIISGCSELAKLTIERGTIRQLEGVPALQY